VLDYLKDIMGLRGKIGVYGRSLGGIATCHLASKVDMIIADRTFADLEQVIDRKFMGLPAVVLFNLTAIGWNSDNVQGYLASDIDDERQINCYKVIACDPQDEMIDSHASLLLGVAKRYVEKIANETKYSGQIGILNIEECKRFMIAFKALQDLDSKLNNFILVHLEQDIKTEKVKKGEEAGPKQLNQSLGAHRDSISLAETQQINKVNEVIPMKLSHAKTEKISAFNRMSKSLNLRRGPGFKIYDENSPFDDHKITEKEKLRARAILELRKITDQLPNLKLFDELLTLTDAQDK